MTKTNNFRIASIDMLRALTMLLMIFVNDLWSLKNIPGWLEHTEASADGMGLADVVFPAFLFLVGMSIPLSVQQRRLKGDSTIDLVRHILERSVALLVMGVFLVNGETINETATGMPRVVWNIICCTCFILLWNSWPRNMNIWLRRSIRGWGLIVLVIMAWLFRGGGTDNLDRFGTQWWGILGLIGWGYLVSAIIYVFSGKSLLLPVLAWAFFLGICIASHAGKIPDIAILKIFLSPLGDGAMPAFTMGGAIITLLLLQFREKGKTSQMLLVFAGIAILLFLAGIYLRGFWGISKIRATPAWVLICSAITILSFIPLYWIADQKGKAGWFRIIEPGGTNTLLCYLLPYFAYALLVLLHISFPDTLVTGGLGLLKSFLFALLMILLAGWLGKRGLRLKL